VAKQLIFISGVGDSRRRFYDFLVRQWAGSGFVPHAYVFGWADLTTNFDSKFQNLLEFLDQFPNGDALYLVGISAGGTAAVNALAARPNIEKVVTVCSPFRVQTRHWNPALVSSIQNAQKAFEHFSPEIKSKLATIVGLRDNVVTADSSRLPEVRRGRAFGFNHASCIFFATVITKRQLRRFLTRA
jgi:pimeloyl-ACP methyl ester carboxylesterase